MHQLNNAPYLFAKASPVTTVIVSTTAALETALSSAQSGETILLASGTYSGLSIQNLSFAQNVTIESQNNSAPATLTQFDMSGVSGLTFSNLTLSTVGSTDYYCFRANECQNVTYNAVSVQGVPNEAPSQTLDSTGLYITNGSNMVVENSSFMDLGNGVLETGNNGITLSGNTFKLMECDGVDNAGSSNVVISNNSFTDFLPLSGDHPDCIQFWTEGTATSAANITITDNTYTRGAGAPVQGIFMGDDSGVLPFENVVISGNTIYGSLYNGIDVAGAVGLQISNNVVESYSAAGYSDMESWIRLSSSITNATLSNNEAQAYIIDPTAVLTNVAQTNDSIISPTVTGTGTVTVTSTTTTTTNTAVAAQPPTGLALDASTASGAAGSDITKDAKVVIDGSAAAGSTVTLYDGTTVIGSGVANASTGAFSIQANAPLANGTHSLTAIATASGQSSAASSALSVIVDTQAAAASIGHVSGSPGIGSSVTLTGTASDAVSGVGYTVSIFQDGTQIGTVTPTNGAWAFTEKNATNAVHTYTESTTDAAGNTGAGSSEVILGTNGNDHIVGGAGNNLIDGGLGVDTLTGGSGTNTFIYNAIGDAPVGRNPETITNWVTGSDHIDLTGLGHLTFGGQTQNVATGSVDWYVSGGNTYVEAATSGHKVDIMIELLGVHNLSASDFVLH